MFACVCPCVHRAASLSTDFSDEVANLSLSDLPSDLYSNDDACLEAVDGSSVDSDELDSDSGYSSLRHRGLVVVNECCCRSTSSACRQLHPHYRRHFDGVTFQTTAPPAATVLPTPQLSCFRSPPLPPSLLYQSDQGNRAPAVIVPMADASSSVVRQFVDFGVSHVPSATKSLNSAPGRGQVHDHVIGVNEAGTGTHRSTLSSSQNKSRRTKQPFRTLPCTTSEQRLESASCQSTGTGSKPVSLCD